MKVKIKMTFRAMPGETVATKIPHRDSIEWVVPRMWVSGDGPSYIEDATGMYPVTHCVRPTDVRGNPVRTGREKGRIFTRKEVV